MGFHRVQWRMRNWYRVALATGLLTMAVGLSACSSAPGHPSSPVSGGTGVPAPSPSVGASTPAGDAPSPGTPPPTPKVTKTTPPVAGKAFPAVPVPGSGSGIVGRVTVTGDCPVQADQPCEDKEYSTAITVTRQGSDTTLDSLTSGTDGSYRVDLPAGSYVLRVTAPPGAPLPVPVSVTVQTNHWSVQNIKIQGARPA